MKKMLLVSFLLICLVVPVSAQVQKSKPDSFDGSYGWYDMYFINKLFDLVKITTTFNACFPSKTRNYVLEVSLDDIYYIDPFVQLKIDGNIYSLQTSPNNVQLYNDGHYVTAVFAFKGETYDAFMKTNQDITIRFSYKCLGGHYQKDYTLPIKYIKEVQQMYVDHQEQ